MKKILLFACVFTFCNALEAQEYVPLQVSSGYNADVIANGVNPSLLSTTTTFDNANFVLMSADFQPTISDIPPDYALPVSGLIDNIAMPGLSYQLAAYSGENSLRLQEQNDFGSLAFSNGAPASAIYLLAATGSGTGDFSGTIHFSDNATQSIEGNIPDWFFSDALPVVFSGFGRVNTTTDEIENPSGDPRLYQFEIAILPENQTKTITSIDFTKTSFAEGVINIFAASAQLLGTCPAPSAVMASSITYTSATITWNAPVILPAMGYQYYISTSTTTPIPTTIPSGATAAGVTIASISGLSPGVHYCVWVRSVCGSEPGPWSAPTCFTPGEIVVIDPNDIPTLYSDVPVDTSSETSCPGTLSVTVPDGFHITSVATNYDMETALNGWMSEQRSLLVCNTTGNMEAEVTSGVGGTTGTYNYSRSGLIIANGATGTVEFELRAWRTYGSSDCNTDYNRVVANTWNVTVTLEQILKNETFTKNDFAVYPNPVTDMLTISGNETVTEVRLLNMLGQEVLAQPVNGRQAELNTSGLSSGKYLLKITSESGTQSKAILKK